MLAYRYDLQEEDFAVVVVLRLLVPLVLLVVVVLVLAVSLLQFVLYSLIFFVVVLRTPSYRYALYLYFSVSSFTLYGNLDLLSLSVIDRCLRRGFVIGRGGDVLPPLFIHKILIHPLNIKIPQKVGLRLVPSRLEDFLLRSGMLVYTLFYRFCHILIFVFSGEFQCK